jgi:hypothetical protein
MLIASEIVKQQHSRVKDKFGSGQYGVSRDGGKRAHAGLDIVVPSGEIVFSPITGNVIRQAFPYKEDKNFVGVVIEGINEWAGYEVKLFYVEGLFSGKVYQGDPVGLSQDLNKRYPKITNHVHVEVRLKGNALDPTEIWGQCF